MTLTTEISVTPAQADIITHATTPGHTLKIVSGPGAGKTTTLVNKLAYLIGEGIVEPEKILVLSMTNRAVDSIVHRLSDLIGEELASTTDVTTFHGLAHRELMRYDPQYGLGELLEDPGWRVMSQMTGVRNKFKLQKLVDLLRAKGMPHLELDVLAKQFGISRTSLDELLRVLNVSNAVTHNDFIRDFKRMLQHGKISPQYDVVVVDEFQDLYPQLWSMVELLARDSHLIVAGDPHQSIYGFLGNNDTVQSHLDNFHAHVDTIEIYECFRSSPEIILASEYVLGVQRRVTACKTMGAKPALMKMDEHSQQYEFIANEVMRLIAETNEIVKPGDIAVLTRTNKELEALTKTLNKYGIETLKLSSSPTWCDGNLFHLLDYLRILNNPGKSHFAVVCTLSLLPNVGPHTVKRLEERARLSKLGLYDYILKHRHTLNKHLRPYIDLMEDIRAAIDPNSAHDIIDKLLILADELGLRSVLARDVHNEDDKNHITTQVLDFHESLKMFEKLTPPGQTVMECFIKNYMDRLPISTVKDAIKVSTIHSSKGLEFPVVFMIGSKPAMYPMEKLSSEDRRVYYVGMTRAKHLLYTTFVEDKAWPVDMVRLHSQAGHLFQFEPPLLNEQLLSKFKPSTTQVRSLHTRTMVPTHVVRPLFRGLQLCKRLI